MKPEEIKQFLTGVHTRLERSSHENSTIPVTEWRIKYGQDVSRLLGIIDQLTPKDEPQAQSKKNRRQQEAE